MKIVTYSLSAGGPPKLTQYHRELLASVKSLRRFNSSVAVHVFLYDEHPASFMTELEGQDVCIHRMGSYEDAIRRIRPRAFRTSVSCPVLHRWLHLSDLEPLAPSQILQIDCDTFFFDDVDLLFDRYAERHFYAREEPLSKASHYGYDPSYLDEEALFDLARGEGASEVGPYNMGVSMFNHGLWTEIAARRETLLTYVFRLTAGICRNPAIQDKRRPDVAALLAQDQAEEPDVAELPFPSSNLWIVDEVAFWLTVGQIPGLTHASFCREDVRQGGEPSGRNKKQIIYHYFGIDKAAFLLRMDKAAFLLDIIRKHGW